jgi:asparagine synthase (glutamine-hydrolysing)
VGGLCGWLGESPADDGIGALRRAAVSLSASTRASQQPKTTILHSVVAVGSDRFAAVVGQDELTLALCGHPRRVDQREPQSLEAFGHAFISAFRQRGVRALTSLSGDYALALRDGRTGSGYLAVDPFGARPLVYVSGNRHLVFGSTLDAVTACAAGTFELDAQAIYNYVYFHVVPGPQTALRGVRRIPPGHYVHFDGAGRLAEHHYAQISFVEDRRVPLAELKSTFLGLLEQATAASAEDLPCGTFLSGGTDSSTVSGMLGRVSGRPAETFSIGFGAAGFDEMQYARLAARHFRTAHHEYYVTPSDVVDAAPRIAETFDQPFGNASAVPTYYCARLAADHGIERLLAGDGGDELFGGNARYARQQLFAYYDKLPAALRSSLLEPILLRPTVTQRLPLIRKARRYVEQALVPMPQRYESGNQVEYIGAENIFEGDFLDEIDRDQPHALMRETHAVYADRSLINQMLGIDFRFILADGDLPKVTRMCELAGIDVVFPMLDARLVAFSAELPPDMKLRRLQLRWFFKEALRDFLPREIIAKKKQGFGLPVGVWLVSHPPLFDLAKASLDRLRQRGIVQPAFLDKLSDRLLHEHPGYYGVLLWVLMMLSLWLDSRRL